MRRDYLRQVQHLTSQLVQDLYALRFTKVIPLLDDHIAITGPTKDFTCYGLSAANRCFSQLKAERRPLNSCGQLFQIEKLGSVYLVTGRFKLIDEQSKSNYSSDRQIVAMWHQTTQGWRLRLLSISIVLPNELYRQLIDSAELYPPLICHDFCQSRWVTINDSTKQQYRINSNDVEYLEGANEYVLVHNQTKTIKVYERMYLLANRQFPDFVRIHRSYYVNPYHVRQISGRMVRLNSGIELPISKANFQQAIIALTIPPSNNRNY